MNILKASEVNPDTAVINATIKSFDSRAMTEASLIKELKLYHSIFGSTFYTDAIEYATSFPNPFGGKPFPSTTTTRITGYSKTKDRYTVSVDQTIDNLDTKEFLQQMNKSVSATISDSTLNTAAEALRSWKTNDTSLFEVISATGWITHLVFNRTVTSPGKKSEEIWEIKMKQ